MKIATSITLGGIYSYTLYVWEQGGTVYHTRFKGEVHCGRTSFYVLIPDSYNEGGSNMTEELKEVVRTHGEEPANKFVCFHPGKVGQLTIHLDGKLNWISTTKISETGNLDLSFVSRAFL